MSEQNAPNDGAEERRKANASGWDHHSETYRQLATMLSMAVPLWVIRYLARGGPTVDDYQRVSGYNEHLERADLVLYGSKTPGEVASWFNALAEAVAVLSFVPGGVELFGQHYESAPLLPSWQQRSGASGGDTDHRTAGEGEGA